MKILIVSTFPTHPTSAGNRAWILGQTETLKELGHDVYFLFVLHKSFHAVSRQTIEETRNYWGDHYIEYSLSTFDIVRIKYLSFCSRYKKGYICCDDKYPNGLSKFVENLNRVLNFDMCIVNYFFLTKLLEDVSFHRTAVSTHDCYSYRDIRTKDPGTMSLTANDEAKAMQRANFIFALQEYEKIYFQYLAPKSTTLNVYGTFNYSQSSIKGNHNILFLASGINYNIEGISWFINTVMPEIRKNFQDAQLLIGGSICSQLKEFSKVPGINLQGYIDDIEAFYNLGDIAINPVSRGTGLKIKTFESLSYDKITIVHPHSMVGIFEPDQAPIFVAESANDWVETFKVVWSNISVVIEKKNKNKHYLLCLKKYIEEQYTKIDK